VVAEFRERLAVSKQESQKSYVERFNLGKLNELEVRNKISDRFVALENLGDSKDINGAWENAKENIKTSAKQIRWYHLIVSNTAGMSQLKTAKQSLGLRELRQHKPRFDEEYLRFLDERKQAKMQWVRDKNEEM